MEVFLGQGLVKVDNFVRTDKKARYLYVLTPWGCSYAMRFGCVDRPLPRTSSGQLWLFHDAPFNECSDLSRWVERFLFKWAPLRSCRLCSKSLEVLIANGQVCRHLGKRDPLSCRWIALMLVERSSCCPWHLHFFKCCGLCRVLREAASIPKKVEYR